MFFLSVHIIKRTLLTQRTFYAIIGGEKELNDMLTINATDVRKNWSEVSDSVIRERPRFIKRTRDYMMLSNLELMNDLLSAYTFTADKYTEADGSITLSLNEIDLVENAETEAKAKERLASAILEYAYEYYNDYKTYSAAPNRKSHIPYVFKAIILDDAARIGECIQCRDGRN
ncbi:MAG: hypothetical protein E7441_04855 [Ruminococcaceae bacterium]|nr:hypothetical protein [Oscillospiraceae bacterium]